MRRTIFILWLIGFGLMGCNAGGSEIADPTTTPEPAEPTTITLMTHGSFAVSEEIIAAFEAENKITVTLLPSGDAGAALNQAILSKDNPLADVFFGVDNTFLSRALEADIFEPYQSPLLSDVPDELELDGSHRLLPVDYGDVCLNYDKAWFTEQGLALPQTLTDLTQAAYKDLLVVENPATSSPGLAFLLATIAQFGTEGDYTYLNYWADLRANGVLVTNGWEDAYYGHFTIASDGERPLVVSYASSPVAEFIYADPPVEAPPSGSLTAPGMCFRQIEFAGILKGTANRALAEKLLDFILSKTFQEDIPLNMFVYPANQTAVLPDAFAQWSELPQETAVLPLADIETNRETWIEAWTDTVLR